jgi:outer membrane protein OmpA-like peptidoglycan-associated protein
MGREREGGESAQNREREHARFNDQIAKDARPDAKIVTGKTDQIDRRAGDPQLRRHSDGVPTVTETHRPSGTVEFRGDFHSSDDRDRVLHPSEGVGYEFGKSKTDVKMVRARFESLPADIQRAAKRGDDNVRVSITASASRAGSEARNQKLSEDRGQDMAKALRDLGVKSPIDVTALGEGRAAAAGAPDVDNPADRVATFQVEVTKRITRPNPDKAPSSTDLDRPKFDTPKTKYEAVAEKIDDQLKDMPSLELHEMIWYAVKMQWLAAAAGYAGASAAQAKDAMESGFALGVLYGADDRTAKRLKEDFGYYYPGPDAVDHANRKVRQNAYQQGLVEGFKQGRNLSPRQRESLWRELGRKLGDRGDSKDWSKKDWKDFYRDASIKLRLRAEG